MENELNLQINLIVLFFGCFWSIFIFLLIEFVKDNLGIVFFLLNLYLIAFIFKPLYFPMRMRSLLFTFLFLL